MRSAAPTSAATRQAADPDEVFEREQNQQYRKSVLHLAASLDRRRITNSREWETGLAGCTDALTRHALLELNPVEPVGNVVP